MARPESVNDEVPVTNRLRKDQYFKIKQLVQNNAKEPIIAIGLVRDLCKGYPAVKAVVFDETGGQKTIRVSTMETSYFCKLRPTTKIEAPKL